MKMSSKFFDELLIYDLKNMSTMISSIKVQKYFFNVNVTKFVFVYILHVVNEKDFDFEYTDFLLKTQDDIELITNTSFSDYSFNDLFISIASNQRRDIQDNPRFLYNLDNIFVDLNMIIDKIKKPSNDSTTGHHNILSCATQTLSKVLGNP
jgi:hypothetical protein